MQVPWAQRLRRVAPAFLLSTARNSFHLPQAAGSVPSRGTSHVFFVEQQISPLSVSQSWSTSQPLRLPSHVVSSVLGGSEEHQAVRRPKREITDRTTGNRERFREHGPESEEEREKTYIRQGELRTNVSIDSAWRFYWCRYTVIPPTWAIRVVVKQYDEEQDNNNGFSRFLSNHRQTAER